MSVIANYPEDSFAQTAWTMLPGIMKFLSVLGILGLLFVSLNVAFTGPKELGTYTFDPSLKRDFNPVSGKVGASLRVVLIEDLQCPICAQYYPTTKQLKADYKDKVEFVFKHYPIKELHPYAIDASKAAIAAHNQGKFEEYLDLDFTRQNELSTKKDNALTDWAKEVPGLDYAKWNTDRSSNLTKEKLQFDLDDVKNAEFPDTPSSHDQKNQDGSPNNVKKPGGGVGTPTTVLIKDGKIVDWWSGAPDYETVKARVDKWL
jgi:hypothetical protein